MTTPPPEEVTQLLIAWRNGDQTALDRLIPLVYGELRRLAKRHMRGERTDHTLQTSALINEAYLRLIDYKDVQWQNRNHFFAIAAQAMRRVLVDHARGRNYAKRGGREHRISLEDAPNIALELDSELIALDDALQDLSEKFPRKCRVVELRYFGGLSVEETAEILEVAPVTVMREWSSAKAWLYRAIAAGETNEHHTS
jgi:RNA polymerase sigma factor (TIGR02999 family)